jgi:hypothetical protein
MSEGRGMMGHGRGEGRSAPPGRGKALLLSVIFAPLPPGGRGGIADGGVYGELFRWPAWSVWSSDRSRHEHFVCGICEIRVYSVFAETRYCLCVL